MNPLNVSLVSNAPERAVPELKVAAGTEIKANIEGKSANTTDNKASAKRTDDAELRAEFFADLQQNLQKLNEVFPLTTTNLSFEFDKTGSESFIRVIDRDNEKVIREIPSEEFRKVAKALDEFADNFRSKGLIFDRTA